MLVRSTFQRLLGSLKNYLVKVMRGRGPNMSSLVANYLYLARQIAKCMMRSDAINVHVYPVRTEMTATKQIPTSRVCSTDKSKLKEFSVNETLSQICYTE